MTTTTTSPKRDRDTEELVGAIRRQIKALEVRAADEDPWVAADMLSLADELNEAATRTVGKLRARKVRWADIGYSLGLTRQGAFNRFARKIGER